MDATGTPSSERPGRSSVIRGPRNFAAGLSLVAVAVFVLWAEAGLDSGSLRAMGPGMVPRAVAVLVGGIGLAILLSSFFKRGEPVEPWTLRGPFFVTLGILAFALTIRTVGLALAGPLVVMIGGAASPESRFKELGIFAFLVTLVCIGLFRYALGLAMPILVIPGVVRI